jgi:glycosyltransferase involved in cell wall biosynthesis
LFEEDELMPPPPSLLMVTWNRREYLEKTIANLLADPSEFELHIWDNGSQDGVRDIVSDLRDPRIVSRHFNPKNAGQFEAWHWFLHNCRTGIAGKLDDDILGPHGWMAKFSEMLSADSRFGVLGGWVYLPSEWDEATASRKIVNLGGYRLFHNGWVGGCIFLSRLDLLRKYSSTNPEMWGTPLGQMEITRDGFFNGYPLPMAFAENLDDPRSPHCRMNRPGGWDQFAAYSARIRKFTNPQEYGEWIAADAKNVLVTPVGDQIREAFPSRFHRFRKKVSRRLAKLALSVSQP